jgi:hypothetical protein
MVRRVRNDVSWYRPQRASDILIERKDSERRIVFSKLTGKPVEGIAGDAPALDKRHDLDQRYG